MQRLEVQRVAKLAQGLPNLGISAEEMLTTSAILYTAMHDASYASCTQNRLPSKSQPIPACNRITACRVWLQIKTKMGHGSC